MNPEEEEFRAAEALLISSDELPHLSDTASTSEVRALVWGDGFISLSKRSLPESVMFFQGDDIYMVECIELTHDSPPLILQSFGPTQSIGSGQKCWEGSLALGRWLRAKATCQPGANEPEIQLNGKVVLEIGAGCAGVPGLVAARDCGACHVLLTDVQPRLLQSLARNAHLCGLRVTDNAMDTAGGGFHSSDSSCRVSVQRLDWAETSDSNSVALNNNVDVILGAELIWRGDDPRPLVATIKRLLRPPSRDALGGVALILMPVGGRGAEASLLGEAFAAGLSRETLALPWAICNQSNVCEDGPTGGNSGLNDNWHLHIFRKCQLETVALKGDGADSPALPCTTANKQREGAEGRG
mmetsp:Transcript_53801/g.106727  ORF Transcript_53801/g.106727 Transcript_53801/m.106727 type:complete len:355 (+) Transcript_53801:179-1243(+)